MQPTVVRRSNPAAVGLVIYGAHQQHDSPYFKIRDENVYRKVKVRMKEWLGQIF